MAVNPKAAGGICLRVKVNEQHFLPELAKVSPKVYAGGGFAHAAFLIDNCVNFSHTLPMLVFHFSPVRFLPGSGCLPGAFA